MKLAIGTRIEAKQVNFIRQLEFQSRVGLEKVLWARMDCEKLRTFASRQPPNPLTTIIA